MIIFRPRCGVYMYISRIQLVVCKGVDLTGLLGDIKENPGGPSPPAGSRGGAPVWGLEVEALL